MHTLPSVAKRDNVGLRYFACFCLILDGYLNVRKNRNFNRSGTT